MKTYTYSEARQRLASLLDQARRESRVQIRGKDGSTFVLQPVQPARSPLDVPGVRTTLRPGEVIRERQKAAGLRAADGPSGKCLPPTKARLQLSKLSKVKKSPRSPG